MGGVCGVGGRAGLRRLASEHPDEFLTELHRLGIRVHEIGTVWSFTEVDALLRVRAREPDSWLFAAVNGWRYPVSREWMMLADLYDLTGKAAAGRRWKKSYPRPWPKDGAKKFGRHRLSASNAREILKRAREGELEWRR